MQIPPVARLHTDVDAITVQLGVDLVGLCGIHQFLQHVARADAPALGFDRDVGGWVVVRLEEVVGGEVGGEVGGDELGVLSAGLCGGERGLVRLGLFFGGREGDGGVWAGVRGRGIGEGPKREEEGVGMSGMSARVGPVPQRCLSPIDHSNARSRN